MRTSLEALVRAGARADKLQQEQAFENGYAPRVWLGEADAPRPGSERDGPDGYL